MKKQEENIQKIFNELIKNKTLFLELEEIGTKNLISFIKKLSTMVNEYYKIDFDQDFEYYHINSKINGKNKIKLTLERVTVMYSYG